MKNYLILLLAILPVVILQSCSNDDSLGKEDPENRFTNLTKSKAIVKANNAFAFEFFKEVAQQATEDNYMVSPVSLSLALGMAYNGAAGDTKTAFDNTLNYDDATLEEVNAINQSIIDNLASYSKGSVFEIANSMWFNETVPIKEDYVSLNREYYYAESQNLNFNNPASVDIINSWVSDKTHEKIPTIIDNISPNDVLYLINALYFNASWKYGFDPKNNSFLPFYNEDRSKSSPVEMMTLMEDLQYTQNELFSSVILPYQDDKFNMVLMLPNDNKTTDDIISEMNSETWDNWQKQYVTGKVSLTIPKFKFDYKNQLNDELEKLGLGIAFTPAADFGGISDLKVFISYVLQKTYIDVNEKGTEAAAVTIISIDGTAPISQVVVFKLDKPFVFVITEKVTGSICFIGRVGAPKQE